MRNITPALLELRQHYESRSTTAQSQSQGTDVSELLQHIDDLLLSELIRTQDLNVFQAQLAAQNPPALPSAPPAVSSESATPSRAESESIAKVEPSQEKTSNRTPRELQPAYAGLKRFEAITQALQKTPGQEVTTNRLIEELFGSLSPSEQKLEQKRLNTLLYNGAKKGLWQKGTAPSSYKIGKATATKTAPKPTAEPTTSTAETSAPKQPSPMTRAGQLQLLPEFEGMSKLAAISKVLSDQAGQVLHQDRIIELLYGELSPKVLKAETRKLRSSLFQGANKGLWDKAPKQPSSYIVKASKSRKAKPTEASENAALESPVTPSIKAETFGAKSGRKPERPKTERAAISKPKQASRGREQVLSLLAEFDGLSKIEAVSKVLTEQSGTVMHIEDIIERVYGELPKAELKAEKDRMKDVMTRGVKRGLWSRASGIPSSFVVKG